MKSLGPLALAFILALGALSPMDAQWRTDLDSPGATEELRLGVLAYHTGRYAEALLLFEKALAYSPEEPDILFWLGRAYYKAGYEATALRAWEPLLERPDAPATLRAAVEALRNSRSLGVVAPEPRYVEAARFEGRSGAATLFRRPATLLPRSDGSFFLVAHGSNEILRLDPNGVVRERLRGGAAGFDRPFGIAALPDGTLYVSEFNGDRMAKIVGSRVTLFGEKGREPGELVGPQFTACDLDGYVYVSDYGNARVVKFDAEGNYVLSFGQKTEGFPGFASPTGIAVGEGFVYVADAQRRTIYRFDSSGNYIGALAEGLLAFPEGLSFWKNGHALLIADTVRVLSFDLDTESLLELYRSPDKKARIVSVVADYNGNLLVSDFDASAVSVLTEAPSIVAGYSVEIVRVDSSDFPQVALDVSVRDRSGAPVVGLGADNFYLSERLRRTTQSEELGKAVTQIEETLVPAAKFQFLGAGNTSPEHRAILLVERSPTMNQYAETTRTVLSELVGGRGEEGSLGLVLAGETPALLAPPSQHPNLNEMIGAVLPPAAGPGRFDLGLRLAATSLLPSGPRDAVVYLGTGAVDESSFAGTALSELGALLENSGIRFYAVVVGEGPLSPSLRYLADRTRGEVFRASRARGLGDLNAELASAASGRYRLAFSSTADADFGRAQLSVAVEAYLYKKSGRDELGYYAPLR